MIKTNWNIIRELLFLSKLFCSIIREGVISISTRTLFSIKYNTKNQEICITILFPIELTVSGDWVKIFLVESTYDKIVMISYKLELSYIDWISIRLKACIIFSLFIFIQFVNILQQSSCYLLQIWIILNITYKFKWNIMCDSY
jgi:hypothetical protein